MDKKMICPIGYEQCKLACKQITYGHCFKHKQKDSCRIPDKVSGCPPCIPYVEPSPEPSMPHQDSLLKMAKDMSDIIIEHPEWNEPIKSVKQVLAEILRKYDCLMMPVKEEQLRKEILDFLTDGYSTHDQQVRKAVIKEAIAFLEEHRLTLEWRAHLRAMAGGER